MKCDIFPADTVREAVKSHQAGLASVHTPILFTAKKKICSAFVSRCVTKFPPTLCGRRPLTSVK